MLHRESLTAVKFKMRFSDGYFSLSTVNINSASVSPEEAMSRKPNLPPMCVECGANRSDPPFRLCPGCLAPLGGPP